MEPSSISDDEPMQRLFHAGRAPAVSRTDWGDEARRWKMLVCFLGVVLVGLLGGASPSSGRDVADGSAAEFIIFHGDGCGHCAAAFEFLEGLQDQWPELEVLQYEVWYDAENRARFQEVAASHQIEPRAVPTMFFDGTVWVGYSDSIGAEIQSRVEVFFTGAEPQAESGVRIDVPFLGSVDVSGHGLLAATVVIGFADGLNPCSLWALSMLLAIVLHSHSRRRVLVVGFVFLGVTSLLYGLYMYGAYSALDYASNLAWIRMVVAAVAGAFGVIQLVSYLRSSRSVLSISESAKPTLYRRMRSLADPERSIPAVIGGTVVLAVGVSLLETPCTAGLPLLWTNMLTERGVSDGAAVALFVVYLSVFLLDELALFLAAVVTLRVAKLKEHHGELLHLIGGSIMAALAASLLVAPAAMETLGGTLIVFGAAGALAVLLHTVRRSLL